MTKNIDDTVPRTPSPQPTHLSQKILKEDDTGYIAPVFEGKSKQMDAVMDLLEEKGFIPGEFIETETNWFYSSLGIDGTLHAPAPLRWLTICARHVLQIRVGRGHH